MKGEFAALKRTLNDSGVSSSESPATQQIERWRRQSNWDALLAPEAVTLQTLNQKLDRIESSLDTLWSYVSTPRQSNTVSRIGEAIFEAIGSVILFLIEIVSPSTANREEISIRRFLVGSCLALLLVLSLIQFVSGFQVETRLARLREQSEQLQEQSAQVEKQLKQLQGELEKGNALQNSILSYVRDAAGR